ncbi:type II secretion system protein GspK [Lacimicrobium alkaliphilum]|uniref:T2SS protein K first SAM-like domain-containing protein n=1 Tax=Lacimicrobium alkaliphilum TaxID=1526571 RepID=A0A0U2JJC3_9ALTE|nr:type II secretion system protein GspK [Lacimicrobium alkaliphilum]ALS99254.1 hypothetical protein AT746_13970 [Lacimicrobium alkaliphilum]
MTSVDEQSQMTTPQQGAALLAVLVVAVVMVVMLGVASSLMQQRLTLAQDSQQAMLDRAEVYAKANELIYLTATQRLTFAGISRGRDAKGAERNEDGQFLFPVIGDELRFDGYTYQTEEGLSYSIQNESGLLPINSSFQYWLKLWLQGKGYNDAEQARFADTLADYADGDTWRRPAGAEQHSYQREQLPPPADFLLQQCTELYKVAGWQGLLERHPELVNLCSLRRTPDINLNAMPLALWKTLWPDSADRLAEGRAQGQWFIRYEDAYRIEPALLLEAEENYRPLGGNYFIISVSKGGAQYSTSVQRGRGSIYPFRLRQRPPQSLSE